MKKSRLLLLIIYCIPFAFLSVNGDAIWGTMLFYGLMIMGFTLLCFGTVKTNNTAIIYIGNILSYISSYVFAKLTNLELMEHYFKPFTSYSMIFVISIVAILFQIVIVAIYKFKNNK